MYDPGPESGELIRLIGQHVSRPITSSFLSALAKALPNDSDVTVFKRGNIPALGFAYADGLEHYHRYTDDPDHIDRGSLQHDGMYALALADALARRDLDTIRAPDLAYFDLFGWVLVRYPLWLARIFSILTVGLLARVLQLGRRRGRVATKSVLIGAGIFLGTLFVSAAAGFAVQMYLGRSLDFFRLVAAVKPMTLAVISLSAACLLPIWALAMRRWGTESVALGVAVVWAILLAAAGIFAPALTPPLQWPLAGMLGGLAVSMFRGRPLALAIGALPAAVISSGLIYSIAIAVGATMAVATALFFAVSAALLLPLLGMLDRWLRHALTAIATVSTIVAIVMAMRTSHYKDGVPWEDSLVYAIDTDEKTARFFTYDSGIDPWVARYIRDDHKTTALPAFSRYERTYFWSALPYEEVTSTEATVVGDEVDAGLRKLKLAIRASEKARCVHIWDEEGSIRRATSIDGAPVEDLFRFSPERDEEFLRKMTGDTSPRRFHMRHCAVAPDAPFELALEAQRDAKVVLRIVAETPGLPATVHPRNARTIPWVDSDVTLVSRRVTF
jgi:hypothetical protein